MRISLTSLAFLAVALKFGATFAVAAPAFTVAPDGALPEFNPPTSYETDAMLGIDPQDEEGFGYSRHLRGRGHRGDYIRLQLARLRLQREVFREYSQRWWLQVAQQRRQEEIDRYWQIYGQGQEYAKSMVADRASQGVCRMVNAALGNNGDLLDRTLPQIPGRPVYREAFRRGMASTYPECLIPGGSATLKEIETELAAITTDLTRIRQDLVMKIPTPQALVSLADRFRGEALEAIDQAVVSQIPSLGVALAFVPGEIARVQSHAATLAAAIDCESLRDRTGRRMSCALPTLGSEWPIDRRAAYRVIFDTDQAGLYQPRLRFADLLEAANTYLTLNPRDVMAREMMQLLRADLTAIDALNGPRLSQVKTDAKEAIHRRLRDLALEQATYLRDLMPRQDRLALVTRLITLRTKITAYIRWELLTKMESSLLDSLRAEYTGVVETAKSLRLEVRLNYEPLEVRFGGGSVPVEAMRLNYTLGQPDAAHFLGDTAEERQLWADLLPLAE